MKVNAITTITGGNVGSSHLSTSPVQGFLGDGKGASDVNGKKVDGKVIPLCRPVDSPSLFFHGEKGTSSLADNENGGEVERKQRKTLETEGCTRRGNRAPSGWKSLRGEGGRPRKKLKARDVSLEEEPLPPDLFLQWRMEDSPWDQAEIQRGVDAGWRAHEREQEEERVRDLEMRCAEMEASHQDRSAEAFKDQYLSGC